MFPKNGPYVSLWLGLICRPWTARVLRTEYYSVLWIRRAVLLKLKHTGVQCINIQFCLESGPCMFNDELSGHLVVSSWNVHTTMVDYEPPTATSHAHLPLLLYNVVVVQQQYHHSATAAVVLLYCLCFAAKLSWRTPHSRTDLEMAWRVKSRR